MIAIYVARCPNEMQIMHEKGVEMRDRVLGAIFPSYSPDWVVRTPEGKPILKQGFLSFSISHSHGVVAFAAAGNFSPPPPAEGEIFFTLSETPEAIGVDVEKVREIRDVSALTRRWFSSAETALVGENSPRFIACFSQKEALSKCSGKGLAELTRCDTCSLAVGEFLWNRSLCFDGEEFVLSLAYRLDEKEV